MPYCVLVTVMDQVTVMVYDARGAAATSTAVTSTAVISTLTDDLASLRRELV